jgi:hypothetical protein
VELVSGHDLRIYTAILVHGAPQLRKIVGFFVS